jgi:dihydroorotate dehydrogenase
MPDWFYRTVSRPILFRLPPVRARNFALGFMGRLARLPLGPAVIDFLGHMRPDPRLRCTHFGIDFPTPVGLGPALDGRAVALPALARFGFGFLEVGPVTLNGTTEVKPIERMADREAILLPDPGDSLCLAEAELRLWQARRLELPVLVRVDVSRDGSAAERIRELFELIGNLSGFAGLFSLPVELFELVEQPSLRKLSERPLLVCLSADADFAALAPRIAAAVKSGAVGLHVDGSIAESPARCIGAPAREQSLQRVCELRQRFGPDIPIIASGGVHEPQHALDLRAAGADLIQVDTGLIFSGPGLPKRINDSILFETTRTANTPDAPERPAEMSWFWTLLMGAGMLFGSILALVIAATRVVLPYDEAFTGLSRDQLAAINPRLLAFMAHDRVSLAGTMIAIGVMYVGLSWFGVRSGLHWARQAVIYSASVGFASFFLFLGFGYLDPFHAFVTAALFQFLLLSVHCRLGTHVPKVRPTPVADRTWLLGQWGQLLLIFHAAGLLGAGASISSIGVTHVFVHEDLDFMQTTAETLRSADPRLVPLVAHDRATFGGMLLASGVVFLLPALWGIRNGSAWLWWTMLIAGIPAYAAAIGVHFAVGYMHVMHLMPAFSGLMLFLLALSLSREHMCRK